MWLESTEVDLIEQTYEHLDQNLQMHILDYVHV
jgi:hypothetical protein